MTITIKKVRVISAKYQCLIKLMLLAVVYSTTGCTEAEYSTERISEELKSWGNFKVGTYWIYEEINSGVKDSVFVYFYDSSLIFDGAPDEYSRYVETIKSNFKSETLNDSFSNIISPMTIGVELFNVNKNSFNQEFASYCFLAASPLKEGDKYSTGPPGQIVVFDSIFDTYTVGELVFDDVVRANDNFNMAYQGQHTHLYSARNIGIIKKEFPETNQTWELVRYHVVR